MYKRLHIFALIALTLVSCSKETPVSETEVRFCATIQPEVTVLVKGGEAEPEPILTDHAVLEIWRGNVRIARQEKLVQAGLAEIPFDSEKLAGGVDYDVFIWVDKEGYYECSDLRNVSLDTHKSYDGANPEFDAFFVYAPFNGVQGNEVTNVTLKRPFAKVNFGAPVASPLAVKFSAPTTLNLKTGEVSETRNFEYTVQPEASSVTAFDYVFATEEISHLNYTFKLGERDEITTSVPVQKNTKTNIIYNITN